MRLNTPPSFSWLSAFLFGSAILLIMTIPGWADSKDYKPGRSDGEFGQHGKRLMGHGSPHQSSSSHGGHPSKGYSGHGSGHSGMGSRSHGTGHSGPHQSASKFIQHILKFKEGMSITEEQENRLRALQTSFKKTQIKLNAEVELASLDLHELLRDEKASLTDIESKLKTVHALRADLYMASIKTRRDAKGVLTDEQRKRMKAVHERMKAHGGERTKGHSGGYSPHGKGKDQDR